MPHELHRSRFPLRVLIAGGGVAGLEAALALRAMADGRVTLTMVSDRDDFHFRPVEVGEPFGLGRPHRYALEPIARDLDMRLVHGAVTAWRHPFDSVALQSGDELEYDALILAIGAPVCPAYEHGVTFDRRHDPRSFDVVLSDLQAGFVPRAAFVVPPGVEWSLAAYELSLLTAAWGRRVRPDGVRVTLVTHEAEPLAAFGGGVSPAVGDALARAGVEFVGGARPEVVSDTAIRVGDDWLEADRIVSLPKVVGPRLAGVPCDDQGFIPVDEFGRVADAPGLYAAGDATSHPIKHGGLAAQQAAAVASHIAQLAGAALDARPYRPVLRGLLRTADGPLYLRAGLDADDPTPPTTSPEPLWWPPSKLVAPRLTSYLARLETEHRRGTRGLVGGGIARAASAR